jgi:sulfate adenylyltransferase large subunit/phosphoadenylyl-sulfate reductase (thioredoxin)
MNILVNEKLAAARGDNGRPLVRVVIAGHVDHGKSTLIGRLLHETNSLPDGKLDSLKAVSDRRGVPFEWSFLLDALQTERDQGITLDTSQIRFRTASRDVVLIDAPGHAEFLRNMITGAAQADAAVLVVDATEGLRDQTRRHCYLLHLLGIAQVAVVINKMDRVGFDQTRFLELEAEIVDHFTGLGLTATAIVPISARHGDGVERRTASLAWYAGPTLLEVLDSFSSAKPLTELPLRIPVQAVYKFDDRRIVAGRVETGRLNVGDEIAIMPRGITARVQSIEAWPEPAEAQPPQAARAGRSVGFTLDRQVFVDRGDIISAVAAPAETATRLRARVFWLHEQPLAVGGTIGIRVGMAERRGTIVAIKNAVDPGALVPTEVEAIARNHVGEIELTLAPPIAADRYAANPRTGRLVLDLGGRIAGGGLILALGDDAATIDTEAGQHAAAGTARASIAVKAARLSTVLSALPPAERLVRFRSEVAGKLIFTTSFGLEDQVIVQMICEHGLDIDIVTLDTGRLFPETYELWAETERRHGRRIRAVYPRHEKLEALVEKHGINGFYESVEVRQSCCYVRKVEPLNRALLGAAGWIVGVRADQSAHRQDTALVAADERDLLKLSPLLDWTRDTVASFAAANKIPLNPLHAQGFASIGCAPCTRAIAPGEPERAGRWWWEQEDKKECGLHVTGDGRVVRSS